MIVTVFEPVPDAGEAFRLNALEAKSIDHEPLAGAVTVTVPEPEPYPEILIFVELIDHASAKKNRADGEILSLLCFFIIFSFFFPF